MQRIKSTSLYVAISLLMAMIIVPVLGTQSVGAAGADPQGTIYVADDGSSAIDVFAPGSSGNVAPERVIEGADTGINGPGDVKVDANGDVWVSNFAEGDGVGNSITEYAPGASGDATPICTIAGSDTGLYANDDMSLEPDGTLVVGNIEDASSDGGNVLVFAPGSCGNVAPEETIEGSNTGFDYVDGVGTDAAGTIFADSTLDSSVQVFPAGANGNVAPEYTISGSNTGLGNPDDIIVGFDGELYVTNGYGGVINSVTVFAPGATGNATPTQDIVGTSTDFGNPDDLAVDASGNMYVTDSASSLGAAVLVWAAGSTGDVAPTSSLVGSNTTFSIPEGVAVAGPPAETGATVSTTDSSTSISLGSMTSDTATVTEGTNGDSPTGSLVFKLFGPSDPTCSNAPAFVSSSQSVDGAGNYGSGNFTPTATGTYTWQALYSGDTNNPPVTTACSGVPAETVTVQPAAPQMTTTVTSLSGGGQSGASISVPANTAVTDTATLTGTNAALATGTVTYDVYSDSNCSTLAPGGGGTAEPITTPGSLPPSASVTLSDPGTYYWMATYSGDTTNNLGSASACGSEVETVAPPPPQMTTTVTSLSGGGQSGASISVPANTAVTDTATLTGTNAALATGTVTYDVYSDSNCSTLAPGGGGTAEPITTPGSLPPSASVTLSDPGTYYWMATYSGDTTNNLGSASACGSEVETVTSATTTPQPTTLKTHLSGSGFFGGSRCWWIGDLITVFAGTAVTDTATLSGTNASSASGTVTYTVYSWVPSWRFPFGQWKMVAGAGTVNVSNGSVPSSNAVTLPPGTYEWQATYSGDGANAPSMSRLGSETEYVIPVPRCSYGWNFGFDGGCRPCPNQKAR